MKITVLIEGSESVDDVEEFKVVHTPDADKCSVMILQDALSKFASSLLDNVVTVASEQGKYTPEQLIEITIDQLPNIQQSADNSMPEPGAPGNSL